MKFTSPELSEDWATGPIDVRLKTVCGDLDAWLQAAHGKEMVMTGLLRTPAEQALIYPNNPTKSSPHLDRPCRAADFRRTHLNAEDLVALIAYFSNQYGAAHKALLLVDDRGPAHPHLHCAVYKLGT